MEVFSINDSFGSFVELEEKLKTFQSTNYVKLWRRDSRTIAGALKRAPGRHFNEGLKYTELVYNCIHGGRKYNSRSKGQRPKQQTYRSDCPFVIRFKATRDGTALEIVEYNDLHSHDVEQVFYEHLPSQRQLDNSDKEKVAEMLKLKANRKLVQQQFSDKTGKTILLKDIHNIGTVSKKDRFIPDDPKALLDYLNTKPDLKTEYVVDENDTLTGIFIPYGVAAGCMLVIVLDTNPAWWGRNGTIGDKQLTLSKCVDSLMVFANSHLMMNHLNKLAFIAAHSNASHFLYPEKLSDASETIANGESHDGKYEMFDQMNYHVKEKIRDLVLNSMEVEFENDSLIAGAVSMALCYIHRMEKETQLGVKMSSRVLVVKASEDNPAQYMNLMNTIFTAQKQNVVIDACILDNDSGLVQQACDITGGVYLKVPQPQGLLQYLLWVYLPDPSTRERLTLPPRAQVDYRAACFCHRNLIDVGYVCSVCLSIFCTFSPICSTCQTTFKIVAPPKLTRKKSKKVSS